MLLITTSRSISNCFCSFSSTVERILCTKEEKHIKLTLVQSLELCWAIIHFSLYLDSHDGICFDMEHFIDTSKISSTNFTHVFQVFSCEIINLYNVESDCLVSTYAVTFSSPSVIISYQFRRYLQLSW